MADGLRLVRALRLDLNAEIGGTRIRVRHLETIDDTPVLDIKPVLEGDIAER